MLVLYKADIIVILSKGSLSFYSWKWLTYIFYVGPRIPDMYPLHTGVLDMRDATLPLRTITATTLLCFWQGRIQILKHISS